jgi:hypothetical protein
MPRQSPNFKHGGRYTAEYRAWSQMKHRCSCPTMNDFSHYGGRGIKVCEAWMNSFAQFLVDMGPRPSPKYSIDRRDNDGNYEPGNCFWATIAQQNRNTRQNRLITYNGKTQCVTDWAKELGMVPVTLFTRVGKLHWSDEKALTTPVLDR